MKSLYSLMLAFAAVLIFSSCVENKTTYLSRFESFVESIEDRKTITEEEMKKIEAEYGKYAVDYYNKFKDTMTNEELIQVAELKARYFKAVLKCGVNNFMEQVGEFGNKAKELLNGLIE